MVSRVPQSGVRGLNFRLVVRPSAKVVLSCVSMLIRCIPRRIPTSSVSCTVCSLSGHRRRWSVLRGLPALASFTATPTLVPFMVNSFLNTCTTSFALSASLWSRPYSRLCCLRTEVCRRVLGPWLPPGFSQVSVGRIYTRPGGCVMEIYVALSYLLSHYGLSMQRMVNWEHRHAYRCSMTPLVHQ